MNGYWRFLNVGVVMHNTETHNLLKTSEAIEQCCAHNIEGLLGFEPSVLRALIKVGDFFELFKKERTDILDHILRLNDGEQYPQFFHMGIGMGIVKSQSVSMLKRYCNFPMEKHLHTIKAPFDFDFFMELTKHTTLKKMRSSAVNDEVCAFFETVQQHKKLQKITQSSGGSRIKKM